MKPTKRTSVPSKRLWMQPTTGFICNGSGTTPAKVTACPSGVSVSLAVGALHAAFIASKCSSVSGRADALAPHADSQREAAIAAVIVRAMR